MAVIKPTANKELAPLARWLVEYLYVFCRGEHNAMRWEDLLARANGFYRGKVFYSTLREAKEYCFDHAFKIFQDIERIHPLCSGPEGIWYATNMGEVAAAADYLTDKGKDLMHKGAQLQKAGERMFGPQQELSLGGKDAKVKRGSGEGRDKTEVPAGSPGRDGPEENAEGRPE